MVIGVKKDYQVYTDADLSFLFSVFYDLAICSKTYTSNANKSLSKWLSVLAMNA